VSPELALAIAITFAGGVVSGVAGFGFALVCVPPLLLLYDPPTVVTASILLSVVTGAVVLAGALGEVRWRMIAGLLPWASLGLVIGVKLLGVAPAAAIGLIASGAVVGFTLAMMTGWTIPGANRGIATVAAGASSGVLNALTGMAGPPVAMLFDARGLGINAFRTSIVGYFVVIDAIAIGLLAQQQVIGIGEFRTVLALIPGAIGGTIAGRWIAGRVSRERFRQVTMTLLLATGVAGVVKALIDLS
jgi:uncharacterized protein